MHVPEHQEQRFKVQKGRDIHEERKRVNAAYLRKKLGVVKRENDLELNAVHLNLRGKVDEVLWLDDGTMAPLDYKYAENKHRIFKNHKVQAALYGILITANYEKPVEKAFLCYTRSKYEIVTLPLDEKLKDEARQALQDCLDVIQTGYFPPPTEWTARCPDCCYRNLCIG